MVPPVLPAVYTNEVSVLALHNRKRPRSIFDLPRVVDLRSRMAAKPVLATYFH